MKCPKCSFVSFNYLNACKKCGREFLSFKLEHSLHMPEALMLNIRSGVAGMETSRLHDAMSEMDGEALLTAEEVMREEEAEEAPAENVVEEAPLESDVEFTVEESAAAAAPVASSAESSDMPTPVADEREEAGEVESVVLQDPEAIEPIAAGETGPRQPLAEDVGQLEAAESPLGSEPLESQPGDDEIGEIEFDLSGTTDTAQAITETPETPPMESDPGLVEELDFDLSDVSEEAPEASQPATESTSPLRQNSDLEEVSFDLDLTEDDEAEVVLSPEVEDIPGAGSLPGEGSAVGAVAEEEAPIDSDSEIEVPSDDPLALPSDDEPLDSNEPIAGKGASTQGDPLLDDFDLNFDDEEENS